MSVEICDEAPSNYKRKFIALSVTQGAYVFSAFELVPLRVEKIKVTPRMLGPS